MVHKLEDKAVKKLIIAALTLLPVVAVASWDFQAQEDAFDEENNRYLAFTRSTTDSGSQLVVACIGGSLSVRIDIAEHLNLRSTEYYSYRYRIDKGEIIEDSGPVNRHGALVILGNHVEPMLEGLRNGSVITIELTESGLQSVRHVYSLSGSTREINKAVSACAT